MPLSFRFREQSTGGMEGLLLDFQICEGVFQFMKELDAVSLPVDWGQKGSKIEIEPHALVGLIEKFSTKDCVKENGTWETTSHFSIRVAHRGPQPTTSSHQKIDVTHSLFSPSDSHPLRTPSLRSGQWRDPASGGLACAVSPCPRQDAALR
jgi:hypothetical protein